jgi:hypothetical protein
MQRLQKYWQYTTRSNRPVLRRLWTLCQTQLWIWLLNTRFFSNKDPNRLLFSPMFATIHSIIEIPLYMTRINAFSRTPNDCDGFVTLSHLMFNSRNFTNLRHFRWFFYRMHSLVALQLANAVNALFKHVLLCQIALELSWLKLNHYTWLFLICNRHAWCLTFIARCHRLPCAIFFVDMNRIKDISIKYSKSPRKFAKIAQHCTLSHLVIVRLQPFLRTALLWGP